MAGKADNDKKIYVMKDGERTSEVIGESLTEYSFHGEDGQAILGAVINPNDTSGIDFLNNEIIEIPYLNLAYYMKNAIGGGKYDFKTRGIDKNISPREQNQYKYRGVLFQGVRGFSQGSDGGITTFASARDIGNLGAGYVAGKAGMSWKTARIGFDGLETVQEYKTINPLKWKSWKEEGQPTQRAERVGHSTGIRVFKKKLIQGYIKSFQH